MSSRIYKGGVLCLLALIMIFIVTAPAQAGIKDEISRTFAVSPGGNLFLYANMGSVEIKTSSGNDIEVVIKLEARTSDKDEAEEIFRDFETSFDQSGNDLTVEAEYLGNKKRFGLFSQKKNKLNVEFVIAVPQKFNVTVETGGGSIEVAELTGEVDVKTSGGSLYLAKIDGTVEGHTSGGSIELAGCRGPVDVYTSGGSIVIGRVEGNVVAHTSGGSIIVEEVFGSIDASTSGGSIKARISEQPQNDCRLETSGGSVTVSLMENINIDVDAQTTGGYVYTDFPVKVRGKLSKSYLRAELNDGGPELYLRTSGGNITLNEI